MLQGVDTAVHLAGIAHQTRRIPEPTYMQVNGHATETLALAVRNTGVRRLIFVSSVRAQSGPVNERILTESQPALPSDAYGRSKLRGEIGVAGALTHAAVDYVILRPVLVYGPGVGGNMRLLARLARSRLPLPVGALDGQRSLVGVEALADAITHAIEAPAASRATLLVADPGPALTAKGMVMALRAGLGRTAGIVPVSPRLLRGGARLAGRRDAVERLVGPLVVDTSALAATGFRPAIGTAAGLYLWMQSEAPHVVGR
jgi:UDP-glucose 4-epimerase